MDEEKNLKESKYRGIPEHIARELDKYEEIIREYKAGKIGEVKFQKFRLQLGTYHQRQEGYQMQRIKIPYGGLTSDQLRRIADVTDKYAKGGFMHLTTRQDVQIYFLTIETVPDLMRELAEVGITTREACGNTIRNVTACHLSGVSPKETFDVTPYAALFKDYMLYNPICQNMGRKFKVCFEGCVEDHAGVRIHDLGFWARVKEEDRRLVRGFQVYVGGGLGASPELGHKWSDFLPVEDMIPFSAAVVRVFDRYGERKVRMKARMKFLIRKLGFDKFKELVEKEILEVKIDPSWNERLKSIVQEHETRPDKKYSYPPVPDGIEKDNHYLKWKSTNVFPHLYDDFCMVTIRVFLGDLQTDTARKLADISDIYSDGKLRVTIQQNLILRWVPRDALPSLYAALREIGMSRAGADTFEDIVACPGADTCRLGITSAKGLASTLTDMMNNGLSRYKEELEGLDIKISGCPNSCAQHVSASIGFQGASITKDGRSVPSEMLFLGGGFYGEATRIAKPIVKIPTRNAPKVVERLLDIYRREKKDGESFNEVMDRLGTKYIKDAIEDLREIPSYEENPSFYKDWGHENEKFIVQHGVKGECAGVTVEERVPTFADAEKHLEKAQALFLHGDYEGCIKEAYIACSESAHVPLYTKLVDPFTPEQTIWTFENLCVRTGEVDKKWWNVSEKFKSFVNGEPTPQNAITFLELAKEFHAECQKLQKKLTSGK